MFKKILATAAVFAALTSIARADDLPKVACDDATFTLLTDAMTKDLDPKMVDTLKEAGDHLKMAMDSMMAGKTDDCTKHVGMAMDVMKMKHQ